MKPSAAPFVPTVLPDPCPKCGGKVVLRQREGRFQAWCQGPECRFGFDADRRGRALAQCPSCGRGRLKTTPKGLVCADCGAWDNSVSAGGRSAKGLCPKCKTGRLSIVKGEYGYFAGCSDLVCGLTYTCDASGRPEGGHCKVCKGPVRKTRAGSRICVVCETWQEAKAVTAIGPRPPDAACPNCGQALRVVLTRRRKWLYRCDPCGRWQEPSSPGSASAV